MSTEPNGFQTPKTNWQAADAPLPGDFNRIEANENAIETGSRTIDPAQTPSGNSGTLRNFLDWFANRIKAITGGTNWWDAPVATLASLLSSLTSHVNLTTTAHGGITPSSHIGSGGTAHAAATTSTAGFMSAADKTKLNGIEAGATADMTASEILTAIKTVDGPGSGLDADLLDGVQSNGYLKCVVPGNTILLESLTERNGTYQKMFQVIRPGRYRITGEIRSTGSNYAVFIRYPSLNTSYSYFEEAVYSSGSSYVPFTVDMQNICPPGAIITVTGQNTSIYFRNIRIRYAEGQEPAASVIQD